MDWTFNVIRCKTADNIYQTVNYHRFTDDMVITVSEHSSKQVWAERALQRRKEKLDPLGVELNLDETRMVNVLKDESFAFLRFDFRRVRN